MRIKWNEQIGKTINNFKILDVKRENNRTKVKTICPRCNKEFWIRAEHIKTQKSCGCLAKETMFKSKDLSGKKFGKLLVQKDTGKRYKHNGAIIWKCKCDCGNTCEVTSSDLKKGAVRSCGCIRKDWQHKHGKDIGEKAKEDCIEGTKIRNLTAKIAKNNTSGIKGVFWDKNRNRWVAQIWFKQKKYYLGRYEEKEDAALARKEAEKQLFGNFIEWYKNEYPEYWEKIKRK